jgi:hypothetical protein
MGSIVEVQTSQERTHGKTDAAGPIANTVRMTSTATSPKTEITNNKFYVQGYVQQATPQRIHATDRQRVLYTHSLSRKRGRTWFENQLLQD